MKLKWLGHACFSLTTADGTVIVTDPFDASVGYPVPNCAADIVTESHQHHDHNDISSLSRVGQVINAPGKVKIGGVKIKALSCYHDEVQGAKRGTNLIFIIEADGQKVVHCGDLGHMPDAGLIDAMRGADALLIPVGGFYTIDAETAEAVRRAAEPRLTVPMHFLTPVMNFPIADEKPFLALNGGNYASANEIDLSSAPEGVLVLDWK